jgi:hypothetical protein
MKFIILAIIAIANLAAAVPTANAVPVELQQRGYDCTKRTPCHPECAHQQYRMWECTCMLPDCLPDSYHYQPYVDQLVSRRRGAVCILQD